MDVDTCLIGLWFAEFLSGHLLLLPLFPLPSVPWAFSSTLRKQVFEVTMVESVYPQVPSAIEAEIAAVDDGAGDSLPVWLHEGHVVDWLLELALVGLVILAWEITDGSVVHEFDLMVEVPRSKGVDLIEERSPCFHSCLFFLAHPGVDLVEASDMVFGLLR